MPVQKSPPMSTEYAIFDCGAPITELQEIWELVKDDLTGDEFPCRRPGDVN